MSGRPFPEGREQMAERRQYASGTRFAVTPQSPSQLVLGQAAPVAPHETTLASQWQCVIVSSDVTRCEALSRAAAEGGWRTIRCRSAEAALATAVRTPCQLAILDVEAASAGRDAEELRRLVEQLACENDLLLLVCGHERDPREEIWARQLGVWLYLPGVVAGPELTTLCGEALEIAERLAHRREPQPLQRAM
jgi:DNA-binding NtrC family response regulator